MSLRPIHWILTLTLASVAAASSHADGLSFTTNYFNGDERIQSCSDIEMRFWREGGSSDIVTSRRSQTLSLGANGAKVIEKLEAHRKTLQSELAKHVVLKYTPHLLFHLDHSIARGTRVIEILREIDSNGANET